MQEGNKPACMKFDELPSIKFDDTPDSILERCGGGGGAGGNKSEAGRRKGAVASAQGATQLVNVCVGAFDELELVVGNEPRLYAPVVDDGSPGAVQATIKGDVGGFGQGRVGALLSASTRTLRLLVPS